eukprot:TRINITY_DN19428_c0_g1_i2.p1 TRINITY_DN19428_c0_g1~~TRINITY_DN19428_c0_g1_i2.p1  ORF type:complete len:209 (-),score=37.85 TRINITY_DN19428_c0_g1_i2:252-878(-)
MCLVIFQIPDLQRKVGDQMKFRYVLPLLWFFFFSSRRRHTRCREVSWARRCVQETEPVLIENVNRARVELSKLQDWIMRENISRSEHKLKEQREIRDLQKQKCELLQKFKKCMQSFKGLKATTREGKEEHSRFSGEAEWIKYELERISREISEKEKLLTSNVECDQNQRRLIAEQRTKLRESINILRKFQHDKSLSLCRPPCVIVQFY